MVILLFYFKIEKVKQEWIKIIIGMNFSITELYLVSSSENELLMNWNTTLYNPSTVWTAFPLSVYNQVCLSFFLSFLFFIN